MSAFDIFIKASYTNLDIFSLSDIATFKCVSKYTKIELDEFYSLDMRNEKLVVNQYKEIDCERYESKPTVLNEILLIKHLSRITMLYQGVHSGKHTKQVFVACLKDFSKHICDIFTKVSEISFQQQEGTLYAMFMVAGSKYIEVSLIGTYIINVFLNQIYKKNCHIFLKDRNSCVLAYPELRYTIVKKVNTLIPEIKDLTTLYPYSFIDKVLRTLMETRRNIIKF